MSLFIFLGLSNTHSTMQSFTIVSWCTVILLISQHNYAEITTLERLDLLYPDVGVQFRGVSHFQTVRDVYPVQIALQLPDFKSMLKNLEINDSSLKCLNCAERNDQKT